MIIFLDLLDAEVEGVEVAEEITLTLRTVSPTAACPLCGTVSSRIQSRYTRTLHDLPSVGRPLRLIMHVRRFFCQKSTCAQKIFVERLPTLCHPHAQRTKRLQEALRQLGLRGGGQAAADVGSELGISGSRDTILRLVRRSPQPAKAEPRIIGLDDWGATRSHRCSCKDSRKEALTWGSAPKCPTRLNQVRLGQRSRVREDGLEPVRKRGDC
jgi:transposase